jgi:hypothetical protein
MRLIRSNGNSLAGEGGRGYRAKHQSTPPAQGISRLEWWLLFLAALGWLLLILLIASVTAET